MKSDRPADAARHDDRPGRAPAQADLLLILSEAAELFHAPDGAAYADIEIDGRRETWAIHSKEFRRWLVREFFEATGKAPNNEALATARNVIEARAHYDAPERTIQARVGAAGDRLYLDLADSTWCAVEIDETGWRMTDHPPVRFRRAAGMRPLPVPVPGGSVFALRRFLNLANKHDFILVIAWLIACLRPTGPYPVLVLTGEQGSAKSTFSYLVRALVDPNVAPLRTLPGSERDLFLAANNSQVLAFDNVSKIPDWLSDAFCRLATGGGFGVRRLYTDQDELLFDAQRPIILNGITNIVTRPDLADRALFIPLRPIVEDERRSEQELFAEFEAERPTILGALLALAAYGLNMLPQTELSSLPRMADFALWSAASETAVWPSGTFMTAYTANRDEVVDATIDADPVATGVRSFMTERTEWRGTATELLKELETTLGDAAQNDKSWPSSPRALSERLRRSATFLRKIGINILFDARQGRARTRMIHITTDPSARRPDITGAFASAPSASSASGPNGKNGERKGPDVMQAISDDADAQFTDAAQAVRENAVDHWVGTAADGADAQSRPSSEAQALNSSFRRMRT